MGIGKWGLEEVRKIRSYHWVKWEEVGLPYGIENFIFDPVSQEKCFIRLNESGPYLLKALEIPFKSLPQFISDGDYLVRLMVKYRLEVGR